MKSSLGASAVLHILLISAGLISLSSPRKMDMTISESLPVDIVPIEELTQIQKGDKKAPLKEKSETAPTKRQDKVENAQETGDNQSELEGVVVGPAVEIGFDARFLVDVASVIDTPQVAIETTAAKAPGVIRPIGDDSFLHVVMPMHLSR